MGAIAGSQENKLHLDETRAGTAAERIFLVSPSHCIMRNPTHPSADRFLRIVSDGIYLTFGGLFPAREIACRGSCNYMQWLVRQGSTAILHIER
jgi:hypothetical protein